MNRKEGEKEEGRKKERVHDFLCLCVCVHVFERERDGEKEREYV